MPRARSRNIPFVSMVCTVSARSSDFKRRRVPLPHLRERLGEGAARNSASIGAALITLRRHSTPTLPSPSQRRERVQPRLVILTSNQQQANRNHRRKEYCPRGRALPRSPPNHHTPEMTGDARSPIVQIAPTTNRSSVALAPLPILLATRRSQRNIVVLLPGVL